CQALTIRAEGNSLLGQAQPAQRECFQARCHIPEFDFPKDPVHFHILTDTRHAFSVCTKRNPKDVRSVPLEGINLLSAPRLRDFDLSGLSHRSRAAREPLPVRAESHTMNGVAVAFEHVGCLFAGDVPDSDYAVVSAARDQAAVRTKDHAINSS